MIYGKIIEHTTTISLLEYQERYQHIERFMDCCRSCPNYGQQWVCPPFDFSIQSRLKPYTQVQIFGHQLLLLPEIRDKEYTPSQKSELIEEIMLALRQEIDPIILEKERSHPHSIACYAGSCKLCPKGTCTRIQTPQKPCRYPKEIRHSLEHFGFDLSATASELLGLPMLWSKGGYLPEYFLLISALLY